MKFLLSNISIGKDIYTKSPFDLRSKSIGPLNLLSEKGVEILETESHTSITDGYLRDLNCDSPNSHIHTERAIEQIIAGWPLPEHITGSFSTTIIDMKSLEITICNDLIGLYPVYYLKNKEGFYVSNSIILMALISGCEFDEVGILQRSIGQDFSNIGARTILKDCKRLLPGQYLKLDKFGEKLETKYDNSLFQDISSPDQKHQLHKKYWEAFKKEVTLCLIDQEEVKVALSGGIDSRVVLGAIPSDKKISCLTFGAKVNYETKIASRLAKIKKAGFSNFYQPDLYFPSYEVLKKYTLQTEAVQICSWLEIMENVKAQPVVPMLLGELCEALPGRNILKYSSRNFRQENFIKYYLLKKDYQFEKSTPENFEAWKSKILSRYLIYYGKIRLNRMDFKISSKELNQAVKEDLEELFSRIEAHKLPYAELYDELFSWYTYTRMRLAKQLQISSFSYRAFSPAMSIQILRNTSNIHPNLRLNYRFAKKLFKESKELIKFNKVPTNQAPLVPQYFPDLIKFPVWGIRSKIDGYLIKRMMKGKNAGNRYRLFKSIDWAGAYQLPDMEKNLKDYFKINHLGEEFFKSILNQSVQRKELNHWPFANIDIMNAASLNMEIDLIKSLREEIDEV
ncbi:hypothetical protein BC962_2831 [Gillisia mitskevichiae]|uniref:asparagine synthase (glutamine-hydrolyzing) n=1 Tax=Gillisia mitskevichiae TaxID=270921 RepID=A0A495P582_9FLAO|nr:hypothetical protein [Gillisia mitskevichiae]RKS45155.1 hypothetical protein BC962_2831 [Gillisia mitskevichiae]